MPTPRGREGVAIPNDLPLPCLSHNISMILHILHLTIKKSVV